MRRGASSLFGRASAGLALPAPESPLARKSIGNTGDPRLLSDLRYWIPVFLRTFSGGCAQPATAFRM